MIPLHYTVAKSDISTHDACVRLATLLRIVTRRRIPPLRLRYSDLEARSIEMTCDDNVVGVRSGSDWLRSHGAFLARRSPYCSGGWLAATHRRRIDFTTAS
jgi:hypothetical protein